jgi:hypothetical protein
MLKTAPYHSILPQISGLRKTLSSNLAGGAATLVAAGESLVGGVLGSTLTRGERPLEIGRGGGYGLSGVSD